MSPWYSSVYTGLFSGSGPIAVRPYDPALAMHSGTLPPRGPRREPLLVGGVGWRAEAAQAACVGEAIERMQPYALPTDDSVEASLADWWLQEPVIEAFQWILFHPDQYAQEDFPFRPFTRATRCRWTCCRQANTGQACWAPEESVFLYPRSGESHHLASAVSTGLSSARSPQQALLRGLQEVIERDAVMRAWWGEYPLEEWPANDVFTMLAPDQRRAVQRPNLRYRFYRVASPFSDHVTIVTVDGEDAEGFCFSAGSACRETRNVSWEKALLEAIHGRHYVRFLRAATDVAEKPREHLPADFGEHALYYSLRPERLQETILEHASAPEAQISDGTEDMALMIERLGPQRPVLFRNLTPPEIAQAELGWHVVRVLVPGLQPLHGDHRLAHLGGPFWRSRTWADWLRTPPHPFP